MPVEEPQVFDIRKATVIVDGHEIMGISEDGFGITPTQENAIISGLMGEVGVSLDPKSGAEATLSLKSTSPDSEWMRELKKQQDARLKGPVRFEIQIDGTLVAGIAVHQKAFGFAKRGMIYAWILKWPEFSTDGKESPTVEWELVGYGYFEE